MSYHSIFRNIAPVAVVILLGGAGVYLSQSWKQQTHAAIIDEIRDRFQMIARQCPPNVKRDEVITCGAWEDLIATIHNNLIQALFTTTYDELYAFNHDLTQEMQRRHFESESDVHWLINRVGAVSQSARNYTERFAPLVEERTNIIFHPIAQFRATIKVLIDVVRKEVSSDVGVPTEGARKQLLTNIIVLRNILKRIPSGLPNRRELSERIETIVEKVQTLVGLATERDRAKQCGDEATVKSNSEQIAAVAIAIGEHVDALEKEAER